MHETIIEQNRDKILNLIAEKTNPRDNESWLNLREDLPDIGVNRAFYDEFKSWIEKEPGVISVENNGKYCLRITVSKEFVNYYVKDN